MKKIILIAVLFLTTLVTHAQRYLDDVNGDNKVNVADVTALVDHILTSDYPVVYPDTVVNTVYKSGYEYPNQWYINLVPDRMEAYLNDFEYNDDDYTYSFIDNYLVEGDYSNQRPRGVLLDWGVDADKLEVSEASDYSNAYTYTLNPDASQFVVYNLIPGRKYYWRASLAGTAVKESHFTTLGEVRLLNFRNLDNVRDIGGKAGRDGKHLAFGRIIRGESPSRTSLNDKHILVDTLGINAVVDLQAEAPEGTSAYLGDSVTYIGFTGIWVNYVALPTLTPNGEHPQVTFANIIRQIAKYLDEGKNIYLHCGGGVDRTGVIAMLIEGLCGVSESDMAKDYEMSSFSRFGTRKRIDGVKNGDMVYEYARALKALKTNYKGDTLSDKIANYLNSLGGLEQEYIDKIRNILLK